MRTVEWLFGVSAMLFVTGVGLVVVGARSARHVDAPAPREVSPLKPVASVRQIMDAIVAPAATAIFESVSTTVTIDGTVEKAPRTPEAWATVESGAVALAEAGNLLMMDGRALDRRDWIAMSQAMVDSARLTLQAVKARDPKQVFDAGGEVYTSCDGCHRQYMR